MKLYNINHVSIQNNKSRVNNKPSFQALYITPETVDKFTTSLAGLKNDIEPSVLFQEGNSFWQTLNNYVRIGIYDAKNSLLKGINIFVHRDKANSLSIESVIVDASSVQGLNNLDNDVTIAAQRALAHPLGVSEVFAGY